MLVRVPRGEPGIVNLEFRNLNGRVLLEDAFTREERLMWGYPAFAGSMDGHDLVRFAGEGLRADSVVTFGGRPAEVVASELERRILRVRTPPADQPGPVTVAISNENGEWQQSQAFLYVDDVDGRLAINGIVPRRIPTVGGSFVIGGTGFEATTRVEVDGRLVPCDVQSENLMSCSAAPHDIGVASVRVSVGETEAFVEDGLEFFDRVLIFDLEPRREHQVEPSFTSAVKVSLIGPPSIRRHATRDRRAGRSNAYRGSHATKWAQHCRLARGKSERHL